MSRSSRAPHYRKAILRRLHTRVDFIREFLTETGDYVKYFRTVIEKEPWNEITYTIEVIENEMYKLRKEDQMTKERRAIRDNLNKLGRT